jgi:cytochrome c
MDFFDKFIIPQSSEHLVLLKYLLTFTYLILFPYLAILFGSTLFSVMYNSKGRKLNNPSYIKFSKSLVDLITQNKSMSFGLGIIPMLSAAFCYAQILHQTGVGVSENIVFAILIFIAALISIYVYKYSFHLRDILNLIDNKKDSANPDQKLLDDFKVYQKTTTKLFLRSGSYGLLLLLASIYLFIGAVQFAGDSSRWGEGLSILNILFSSSTLIFFLFFIASSISLTALLVLYMFFKSDSEEKDADNDYKEFVKGFSLKTGLIFSGIQFVLIAVSLFTIPKVALSNSVFLLTVGVLFLLLLICNLIYFMLKESNLKYRNSVLFLFLIFFAFTIIKDQYAFDTSSQIQVKKLAQSYNVYEKSLLEKFGAVVEVINGEDIYNGRCIACHQFEQKLVGPPYKSVLPKYDGKRDELVKFILNPVKVNPEYPAMPNQGLKPKEAEAIADYLIQTYKQ